MESICCGGPTQSGIVAVQKKDFVMSLADDFKYKVLLPVTMTLAVATTPFGGGKTAQARSPVDIAADFNPGGKDDPDPSPAPDYKIEPVSKQNRTLEEVMFDAKKASKKYGAMVIVIHSNKPEFHSLVTDAAQQNYDAGRKRLMVFSHNLDQNGEESIMMYGCGDWIGWYEVPEGSTPERLLKDTPKRIAQTYDNKFVPLYNKIYGIKDGVAYTNDNE